MNNNIFLKIKKFLPIVFLFFLLIFFWKIHALKKENKKLQKQRLTMQSNIFFRGPKLPPDLQSIPLAESSNLVLNSKEVKIRNVPAPHNASLIKNGSNYLLFFRYDVINQHSFKSDFFSYIGCAELDSNFEQTEKEFVRIDTHSHFSEDPRAVQVGKDFYLIYNDLHSSNQQCRSMHLANINLQTLKTNFITELDFQMQQVEKNWIPFEYIEDDGKSNLYFEYYLTPHSILKLPDPKTNSLHHLIFPNHFNFQNLHWPNNWGEPRGGTVVQKIGNEYLGFFHSAFRDNNNFVWYVIGAYTFEAKPPFRITSISNYPIFFDDIYNSTPVHTANPLVRCLFPCSFVIENRSGRELIQLSCGENDSHVKIVTIDKKTLLKSLKKI